MNELLGNPQIVANFLSGVKILPLFLHQIRGVAIVVSLWPSNTKLQLYPDSHSKQLDVDINKHRGGFFIVRPSLLQDKQSLQITKSHGGMLASRASDRALSDKDNVFFDGRCCFQITNKGGTLLYLRAEQDLDDEDKV